MFRNIDFMPGPFRVPCPYVIQIKHGMLISE